MPSTAHLASLHHAALLAGESRTWAQIGFVLHAGDEVGVWREQYPSFTDWLKKLSEALHLKEASLWRYLAAYRYYLELHANLRKRSIACPEPVDLPETVSPENLELLGKLSRVVPAEMLPDLAQRVLSGEVTRADLRQLWSVYRPALAGRTARGKGVSVPRVSPVNPVQYQSLLEAQVFATLSTSGVEWTGISKPAYFEFFMGVRPVFPEGEKKPFEFDAVIMVGQSRQVSPTFHGIEIRGTPYFGKIEDFLLPRIPYCDYLWVATCGAGYGHRGEVTVPDYVGLLDVSDGRIEVKQYPRRLAESGTKTGDLAKGILLRSVRR
ncbi:hypothetical protein [Dechloromonas sp. ZS-1]|uniref:hypothetical protein n=1 Tax=Dechloromonas sp. ZS-1 TaxID=3138067 RepID=UPI0031FE33FD